MRTIVIAALIMLTGCASVPFMREKTPQEQEAIAKANAQEAATERFETCMNSTLSSFGPFRFGTQEARLKAAEICKDVMKQ